MVSKVILHTNGTKQLLYAKMVESARKMGRLRVNAKIRIMDLNVSMAQVITIHFSKIKIKKGLKPLNSSILMIHEQIVSYF